jgi:hypothetical protein
LYNLGSTSANVKAYQRDLRVQKWIRSDAKIKTIESGKQGKHIKGLITTSKAEAT